MRLSDIFRHLELWLNARIGHMRRKQNPPAADISPIPVKSVLIFDIRDYHPPQVWSALKTPPRHNCRILLPNAPFSLWSLELTTTRTAVLQLSAGVSMTA